MPFTKDNAKTLGARGGTTTATRHGRDYMRRIGKRGFENTVTKHWKGKRDKYLDFLHRRGLLTIDPMPQNGAWQRTREWGDTQ